MPRMVLVTDDTCRPMQVDNLQEVEKILQGKVKSILLDETAGMYVLEDGAARGFEMNNLAVVLYALTTCKRPNIFGPVLVFGLDSENKENIVLRMSKMEIALTM
jgi:altronate dehydratase